MALLAIDSQATYTDIITCMEYHTHLPYASTTFKNNDEIRIPIAQQDLITAPFESFIVIHGKVEAKKADGTAQDVSFVNNAMAFLFEEIRYEIFGKEIDRNKNVGITSTLKNILSVREEEKNVLKNACWLGPGNVQNKVKEFVYSVPLKHLLGFAEDFRRVLVNSKQELVLLRSATDVNVVQTANTGTLTLDIDKIYWRIPHITVNDAQKLKLYKFIEKNPEINIPFRSWDLFEYPNLPATDSLSWTIKTSNQTEKPRYVVLAFQTNRKGDMTKDMSQFDACELVDVKLYLNSNYYPYDNIRGNFCLFYDMFANFQPSYYGTPGSPTLDFNDFKTKCPIYVIDCSKQDDSIKTGPVDVRLDIQTKTAIPANTYGYCLIIHDSHYTYTPITGEVKKVSP